MKLRKLLALAMGCALAFGATAQDKYPSKPVRIIVPFSSGSGTDIVARMYAEHMSRTTGQGFVVENRQGADGIVGAEAIAKAAPDGYTLGVSPASPITMNPALYSVPYDSRKDFIPVINFAGLGYVLVVNASFPAKNLAELIAYAKANPGKVNYAAGSTPVHIAGEWLKIAAGIDLVAIPYKGTAPQVTAVLSNEVAMTFDPFLGIAHVRSGKMRPLAVTSQKRSSVLPEVPTMEEAGIKGLVVETWIGLFAPVGTPKAALDLLQSEGLKFLQLQPTKDRLASLSYDPIGMTTEPFARLIDQDLVRWQQAVQRTGIKVNK